MKYFLLAFLFCAYCSAQYLPGQKGEPGVPGPVGPKGEPGIGVKGPRGDKGKMGNPGFDGLPGPRGFPGPALLLPAQCNENDSHADHHNMKGEPGERGLDGLPGRKGQKGEIGPIGLDGAKGYAGARGDAGLNGPKGDRGFPGRKGDSAAGRTVGSLYPKNKLNQVKLGDRKYVFVDQMSTWMEASYFCNSHGMELVTIETQQENEQLMTLIETLGLSNRLIWTSAHKLGRFTFLWQNGEAMNFTDWKVGQPDSAITEHCMVLHQGDWQAWICHAIIEDRSVLKTAFICEDRQ